MSASPLSATVYGVIIVWRGYGLTSVTKLDSRHLERADRHSAKEAHTLKYKYAYFPQNVYNVLLRCPFKPFKRPGK